MKQSGTRSKTALRELELELRCWVVRRSFCGLCVWRLLCVAPCPLLGLERDALEDDWSGARAPAPSSEGGAFPAAAVQPLADDKSDWRTPVQRLKWYFLTPANLEHQLFSPFLSSEHTTFMSAASSEAALSPKTAASLVQVKKETPQNNNISASNTNNSEAAANNYARNLLLVQKWVTYLH